MPINSTRVFLVLFVSLTLLQSCIQVDAEPANPSKGEEFSFAFLTDIHLNMGSNNCFDGFRKAVNSAKTKGVDFIITGGDNCDIDVLNDDTKTAHELYNRFSDVIKSSKIPFYPTLGNQT